MSEFMIVYNLRNLGKKKLVLKTLKIYQVQNLFSLIPCKVFKIVVSVKIFLS